MLKGRPIITAHSWCTVEASKFLQAKLRGIISDSKLLIQEKGIEFTILRDSKELVNTIKNFKLDNEKSYNFINFDFEDLYTNILFDDAERTLRDLAGLLGTKDKNINLILDLYKFCNEWNYFNVGNDLFRQEKGVSMGCYFSKEIIDLVLLYSEYKFLMSGDSPNLELLKRYADDGLAVFNISEEEVMLAETKRLQGVMSYYPRNLVINLSINKVVCTYLDLQLSIDDVSDVTGLIHVRTYFKQFHKFVYLDPSSNHPNHVFKG